MRLELQNGDRGRHLQDVPDDVSWRAQPGEVPDADGLVDEFDGGRRGSLRSDQRCRSRDCGSGNRDSTAGVPAGDRRQGGRPGGYRDPDGRHCRGTSEWEA